jgi:uroporphyrinogen decarboxylase
MKRMNPRENLLSLYRRDGYEFMPIRFAGCPTVRQKITDAIGEGVTLAQYYNYEEGFARVASPSPHVIEREEEVDWRSFYSKELNEDTGFDAYGVAHESGYEGAAHMSRMHHPMADVDSLEQMQAYPWPEWDFDSIEHMKQAVEAFHNEGRPVVGEMSSAVWETAWAIRDMTMLMTDMMLDDEKATFVLDKVTADSAKRAAAFARAGADIINTGDDIGMQDSIMMSEELYREWLKPRLAKVIAAAKAENPDVLVLYHSCGYVRPFIPDLIEAGVDILNPVQPECMDFADIHAEFGDKLSFCGTIGTQTTMPFGTPEEVREVVLRNLDIAGSKGGLVACPTHLLEPEVPWANIDAYIKACIKFSRSR